MGYEHHFEYDVPDFVREAEEAMARGETFGTEAADIVNITLHFFLKDV